MLHGAIERFQTHVFDQRVVGETGVVDQNVDAARAVEDRIDQTVPLVGVFEVGRDPERRTTGGFDQFDRFADGAGQRGGRTSPRR